MLCTVTKSFKNSRGETLPPGSTIDVPDTMLLKMTGYVLPMGQADNGKEPVAPSDWKPEFKAWLENDQLRTTGTCDDLAVEIVKLTADNLPLQKELLLKHVGAFSNPCWTSTARKFVQRAKELFDGGMGLHEANYQIATEMHLLAFSDELGINLRVPTGNSQPF